MISTVPNFAVHKKNYSCIKSVIWPNFWISTIVFLVPIVVRVWNCNDSQVRVKDDDRVIIKVIGVKGTISSGPLPTRGGDSRVKWTKRMFILLVKLYWLWITVKVCSQVTYPSPYQIWIIFIKGVSLPTSITIIWWNLIDYFREKIRCILVQPIWLPSPTVVVIVMLFGEDFSVGTIVLIIKKIFKTDENRTIVMLPKSYLTKIAIFFLV